MSNDDKINTVYFVQNKYEYYCMKNVGEEIIICLMFYVKWICESHVPFMLCFHTIYIYIVCLRRVDPFPF